MKCERAETNQRISRLCSVRNEVAVYSRRSTVARGATTGVTPLWRAASRNLRSRTLKIFFCFVSMFYFGKKLSDLRPMALARFGLEISGSFFPSFRRQVCWANSFLPRLYKLILRFREDRRWSAGWKNVQEGKLPPLETHSAVNSFHSRRIL
jgi:hypothetical protein